MAVFTTSRYPEMQVRTEAGKVQFRGGRAEVNAAQAKALRAMGEEYELVEVKPDKSTKTPDKAPEANKKPEAPDASGGEG